MSDKHVDEANGRVREGAGSLSGDGSLMNEGEAGQAKSSVDGGVDTASDRVNYEVDRG